MYALQQAMKATFDESKWLEVGYAIGKADVVKEHPRLLRSLQWGDSDYGRCIFDVLPALLGRDLRNVERITDLVGLENWLQRKAPDLYDELYEANDAEEEVVESNLPRVQPQGKVKVQRAAAASTPSISPDKELRIFLCHASEDKEPVRQLHARLKQEGFRPWLDEEDLLPGQDWQLEISKAVRDSQVVLVCMSTHSTTKTGFLQKEIKVALDVADEQPEGTIFVIPALLEKCAVPERLRRFQWVDLPEPKGFAKLLRALRQRASTINC